MKTEIERATARLERRGIDTQTLRACMRAIRMHDTSPNTDDEAVIRTALIAILVDDVDLPDSNILPDATTVYLFEMGFIQGCLRRQAGRRPGPIKWMPEAMKSGYLSAYSLA